ncbi:DUF6300 family protein [Streptomyces longisporus]|uniref:Uncharacterized protein n=1 Tax=Streptomyces longisporus TaxID=1948 RepID=A0ABN3NJG1_STRLO
MHRVVRSERLPQCSRCQGKLITSAVMPKDDDEGRPIHLELCAVCDADKPAAAAMIRFFTEGGGRDVSRAEEGARLLWDWAREGMAAHGWVWEETPSGQN